MIRYLFIILLLLATITCREKYDAQYSMPETGFLVVEGFINTTGKTVIHLSRTSQLTETKLRPEVDAVVRIEGEDNSFYPLNESDTGIYVSEELQLSTNIKYRIHIKTQSVAEYASEFHTPLQTSEIDSLTYERTNGGVEIFVNANDSQNSSKYYKWDYEETWEFRSAFPAYMEINVVPGGNPDPTVILGWIDSSTFRWDSARYFCWQSRVSTGIIVGTTSKLSSNRAYASLVSYPKDAWEFSWLYSINVRQTGISKEAFEFYEKMKKNTELLGSVFDAFPSEISGNMVCISNPQEPVLGYIDVTSQLEKRLFITNEELSDWNYFEGCTSNFIAPDREAMLNALYEGFLAVLFDASKGLKVAPRECVDCRLRGTNIKPSFWPW